MRSWGRVAIDAEGIELTVLHGCLDLAALRVTVGGRVHDLALPVLAAGATHRQPL